METGDREMKQVKVYTGSDGRRMYAVNTTSRQKAAALFSSVSTYIFSAGRLASHGFVWTRGQVAGTDIIFDNPGVVFIENMVGAKCISWDRVEAKEPV